MEGIVLSWQIEDIRNEDLYKDEIKEIPDEFQSVGDYLESYTLPLIEETRAELFSGLETISVAPCARIRHIALRDTIHGLDCKMDILADGFSGGADMYEPKNAIVKKVVEFELDEVVVKQFTMSVSPTITSDDQIQRCTCALYLTSTVTNSRIWKALHYSQADQNFRLIKKVLSRNQMESICDNTHEQNNPEMTRVLEQILSIDLNQSQLEVVKSTISAVQCNESSSIELVWGPPGTGKTKTVGSVLWSLKQFKIRTLTCAPTNVAEVEFRGMVKGICELLWLRKMITELKLRTENEMKLYCDNKAAIDISQYSVQHDRTKRIEVESLFIKENLDSHIISLSFIRSTEQAADILTNVVATEPFEEIPEKNGMTNIYVPS